MSIWIFIQIAVDVLLFAGLSIVAFRLLGKPKDDPRLSKGLQLLQSKISVLEDICDRSDNQMRQMGLFMEQKSRDLQAKLMAADQKLNEISASMDKSMEVAKIFEDRIPHKEIIERQSTVDYVKAARMAHAGRSLEEIQAALPRVPHEELELVAKLNRHQLMFSESALPEWVKREIVQDDLSNQVHQAHQRPMAFAQDFSNVMETPQPDYQNLEAIHQQFQKAVEEFDRLSAEYRQNDDRPEVLEVPVSPATPTRMTEPAAPVRAAAPTPPVKKVHIVSERRGAAKDEAPVIMKVQFPRIEAP